MRTASGRITELCYLPPHFDALAPQDAVAELAAHQLERYCADADYVFDVRMLPNPHYEPHLKALTGTDAGVISYLTASSEVLEMQLHIQRFVQHWLPALKQDHRAYVTVAIGCTGGQHRSVYLVEQLTKAFKTDWPVLVRHRELG